MKKSMLKIMVGAALALIIPLLGNIFVEGWNWSLTDFIFAWVFWVVMGTTILFATKRCSRYQWLVGIVIFLCFVALWVLLATG